MGLRLQLCLEPPEVLEKVKRIPQLGIKGHPRPFLGGIVCVQQPFWLWPLWSPVGWWGSLLSSDIVIQVLHGSLKEKNPKPGFLW